MDIIERYLEAVAAQLPTEDREDIVAELRDLILSRVEAREEELGRTLSDEEKEAILHEIGHPLIVAARYRKGPDSLIGPELFPYWLFGAKAGLMVIAAVQVLGLLIHVLGAPADLGRLMAQAFHGFFSGALTLLGALTLAGAVMEHYDIKPKWLTKWRVRDLSAFGLADPAKWGASMAGTEKAKAEWLPKGRVWGARGGSSRLDEALWSLVFGGLFLLWWMGVIHFEGLSRFALHGGETAVSAAPVWSTLYGVILAWVVAGLAVDAVTIARGGADRVTWALRIPLAGAAIWIAWRLFDAGWWFTLTQGEQVAKVMGGPANRIGTELLQALRLEGRGLEETAVTLGAVLSWVLVIAMIGYGVSIVQNLWRIATTRHR